ncbi:nuclear transport factor 2 family protein [Candidatus Solirubrobacter pratensis]|uniref:nuclear transport factor 2 family protein n=1 Tax=Candidatus Solirubrobacter pratensis TaxID=1298857 RepID=UPI001E2BDBE1|nr:nuclear transport factor 2 family protein [Candidatus Solirubrobacter pratensis]
MVAALVLALGGSATALVLTTKHANPSEQSTADVSGSDPASDTSSEAGTSDGSGTSGDTGSASDSGSDTSGTTGSDYGSDTSSTGGTDDSSGSNDSSSSYDDSSSASNSDTSTSASRASSASPETKVERAVRRHWRYIESGDYDAAFDLLAPSLQASSGGQASWVAQHEKDNLLSVDVSVTARDVSGSTAIVDVDTLRTDAEVTGCKDWSGYYEMVKTGGRWKIAKAKLAPSSC